MKGAFLVVFITLSSTLTYAQRYPIVPAGISLNINKLYSRTDVTVSLQDDEYVEGEDDENLPFEDDTAGNWVAKLFLWFIYLMIGIMILGATYWFFTARGFWSWVVCLLGVFFYAMLLGRYWGYGLCYILFAVLFTGMKLILNSAWGRKKFGDNSE